MKLVNNQIRSYKQDITFPSYLDSGNSKADFIIGNVDLFEESNYEGYKEGLSRGFYQLINN